MFERTEREFPEEGDSESGGISEDAPAGGVGGQGREGGGAAAGTPEIGEDGEPGQTEVPAPEDEADRDVDEQT
jgi:hypothetical protein